MGRGGDKAPVRRVRGGARAGGVGGGGGGRGCEKKGGPMVGWDRRVSRSYNTGEKGVEEKGQQHGAEGVR